MNHRPILLSLTTMHKDGLQILKEATELRMASALDPATLQREIVGADALIIRTGGVVDAALLDRGDKLKVVGRHGVGYDQIDVDAATARGIQVVYTPGANTQSVAEHVFALLIGLSRHFPRMSAGLIAGNYHVRTSLTGREIAGKTLGIVGFGRIGRLVGEIGHRGFGMKILYHDIVPAPPEVEARSNARRTSLEEALGVSEYVTLHVPLDSSTRRLIRRETLALMRSDAILLNTCRGPVVDEEAVAEALDNHRLWGYGADVFTVEPPPPGHPLIGRDDVIVTPHSAAQTEEGLRTMAVTIATDVVGILRGNLPMNAVNAPGEVEKVRERLGLTPLFGGMA
jgi:D-3-phosphoglycerate dehydrogenase / 2-oxoglutarate reductase